VRQLRASGLRSLAGCVSLQHRSAFYPVTGQLADTPTRGLPTRGLDISWTGQLADWTSRGLDNLQMPPAVAVFVVITLSMTKNTAPVIACAWSNKYDRLMICYVFYFYIHIIT